MRKSILSQNKNRIIKLVICLILIPWLGFSQPRQLNRITNLDLNTHLLGLEQDEFYISPFFKMEPEKQFQVSANYKVNPTLKYEKDSLNYELLDWGDSLGIAYKTAPFMMFFGGRNESAGKSSISWEPEESFTSRYSKTHYPLGIYIHSHSYSKTKIPLLQLQQVQLDWKNQEWEFAGGYGDSTFMGFKLELMYRTERHKEEFSFETPELGAIEKYEGNSDSRYKLWKGFYSMEFAPCKIAAYYQLVRWEPEDRPDRDLWMADTARYIELGGQYIHKNWWLKNLEIHYKMGFGKNETEGIKLRGDSAEKRFHYGKQTHLWNRLSINKPWKFTSGVFHHTLSPMTGFRYFRFNSTPLPYRTAEDQFKESFNYRRLNSDWFTNEYGFLGFYGDKYEIIDATTNIYTTFLGASYKLSHQYFSMKLNLPFQHLDFYGKANLLSVEKTQQLLSVKRELESNSYKAWGKLVTATPRLDLKYTQKYFSIYAEAAYMVPLYNDLNWSGEDDSSEALFEERDGESGFSFMRTGISAEIGTIFYF